MSQTTTVQVKSRTDHDDADEHNHDHGHEAHDHSLERVDLVWIGLVALACLASWLGLWQHVARWLGLSATAANFDVIALVATLAGGYPIFKEAVASLLARRMTMELSMTIALAAALAICMFSMSGIPPLAGFFGKLYVFLPAVAAGYYGLAVIGVLTSVVSAFYYLRVVKIMYFDEPAPAFDRPIGTAMGVVLAGTSLFTLLFFVYPAPLLGAAAVAAAALFAG